MRCIVEFDETKTPPVLRLYIHGAPHRRVHVAVLRQYREALWDAWVAMGRNDTLKHPIELTVTYINPTGPDLDNLLTATFQALDGKCGKGRTILADDRLVSYVKMGIMFS
jgi:hypothetical protein